MNLQDSASQVRLHGEGNDVSQSRDASAGDPVLSRKKAPPKRPPSAALPVHRGVASAAAASTTGSAFARVDSSASTAETPVDPAERNSLLLAQLLAAATTATGAAAVGGEVDEDEWVSLPSLNWSDTSENWSLLGVGDAQSIDHLGSGATGPSQSVQRAGGETSGPDTKAHTGEDMKASNNSGAVSIASNPLVKEAATPLSDDSRTVSSFSSHSDANAVLGVWELLDGILESNRSTLNSKSGETSFVVSTGSPTTTDPTSKSSITSLSRPTALSKDLMCLVRGQGPPDALKEKGAETTRLAPIKEEEWSEDETSRSALSEVLPAQVSTMDDAGQGGGFKDAREKLFRSIGGEELGDSTATVKTRNTDRTGSQEEERCQQTVTGEKAQSTPLQENSGLSDKRDPEKIRRHIWNLSERSDVYGLVKIMQQHSQVSTIQEEACAALRNLSLDGYEARQKIGKAGGVRVVLSAVKQHASVEAVQREAIGTLCVLAKDSYFNRSRIAESNGILLLLRAMRQHMTNATIQEKTADALSKMAVDREFCELIVAEEGVTIILKAMKEHLSEADVLAAACCALSRLAENNEESRTRLAECGGGTPLLIYSTRRISLSKNMAVGRW